MDDLLELAASAPERVPAAVREVLASSDDDGERAVAHQALAIVHRDGGQTDDALTELRTAMRLVQRVGDDARLRDVRATYGTTLVVAGRTREGLRQLEQAATGAEDAVHAKVLLRWAGALGLVSRFAEAVPVMLRALEGVRAHLGPEWEARTLNSLGFLEFALGSLEDAEGHVRESHRLFLDVGDAAGASHSLHNLGAIASHRGDVAAALRIYDTIAGDAAPSPRIALSRAQAYLSVGLTGEAVAHLRDALEGGMTDVERGLVELRLAQSQLADGDLDGARRTAEQAWATGRRQLHPWLERQARLVVVRARHAAGDRGLAEEARTVALLLDTDGEDEAALALALAGDLHDQPERARLLEAAAAYRDRPGALVRAAGWLALARARADRDDRAGVLRACDRGLSSVDDHRSDLGSSELRAIATAHGRDLSDLAVRHAAGRPRALLRWAERSRATALTQTAVSGQVPSTTLAALRRTAQRLAEALATGEVTQQLVAERVRLERAVRAEHHQRRAGDRDDAVRPMSVDVLVAHVGADILVEIVDVGGVLHVLVVHDGRVRRRVAGTTSEVLDLVGFARFALRRAARSGRFDLGDLGARLQATLLGDAVRLLGDGPLVVSPPGRLHGVPWALLPTLADRPFTVVPSAAQWVRARQGQPTSARTVLVSGPGLGSGGAEVPALAERYPDAVVLTGSAATVDAGLAALDGARLAHVAAHGHFRADSPLFSSLELADGPLTVHDLERLGTAPHRMVLSACESGVLAPVGADELLGLASALFSMGSAGLVCSVAEVDDAVTADLMLDLHGGLAATPDDLGSALLTMRRAAGDDPVRAASAAAFVALGV